MPTTTLPPPPPPPPPPAQPPPAQPPPPSTAHPPPASPDEARRARRRVAAEARKRIANACLACKSRKQKCDGQQPCNICSRRGASCIYVQQPPRHAKRRRASPLAESSTGGDGASERTSVRSTRSPCSPDQHNQHNQHALLVRPRSRSAQLDAACYAYPTPGSGNSMPPPPLDADSADLSDGAETSDEEAPVEHRTRMLFDPSGRLLYIGETGSLSILARARKLVHTCFGQSSFTQDSAQNSIADTPLIPHMQYSLGISSVLPPHQRATALVDLFFQHVNRVYYVLDRAEMDQIMATVYSGGILPPATGNRLRDMSFVNAVCAVGTFFNGRSEQSVADGMRYFDSSRSVMEDVFESSDFFSVRHLLIFALYMQYAAKRNSAWTYVGLAIRVAESLGLHRLSSIEHSADPFNGDIDLERRRRLLFWTLYSLDRFTGCSLGRPLAVDDDNCNDPIFSQAPSDDYLVDSRCTRDQPDVIHQRHQLASRVRLHVIIGHIVKRVYLRRAISRDVAESLSEELKAWWKSLPSCASLNGGTDTGVMQLHMTYLHAVTLLTRPFLQQVVEASVEESMGGDDCQCKRSASSRSRIKRKMLRYAVACVLVAERTVTLALRMHKQGNLTRNDPTLIYYLFTAGLVLMFSVLPQIMCAGEDQGGPSGEDDIANFRARAPALIAIMGECAAVEPCTAKRYHSILLQFAQAIVEGKERRQRYREELAQKTRELETREVVTRPAEPDLLDELQATSNEYFAVSYRSRAGSDEPPSRESLAAHALVSVASNGQDQNQMMPPPPYISVTESSMGVVSSMQQSGLEALHMEREPEIIAAGMAGMVGMGDFSNFFGWFEEGGFNESPAAVPWELSWDGPPNNYFASANPRMGPDGG